MDCPCKRRQATSLVCPFAAASTNLSLSRSILALGVFFLVSAERLGEVRLGEEALDCLVVVVGCNGVVGGEYDGTSRKEDLFLDLGEQTEEGRDPNSMVLVVASGGRRRGDFGGVGWGSGCDI